MGFEYNQKLLPGIEDLVRGTSNTLQGAQLPSTNQMQQQYQQPLNNPGWNSISQALMSSMAPEFNRQQRNLGDQFRIAGGSGSLAGGQWPTALQDLFNTQTQTAMNALTSQAAPFMNIQQQGARDVFQGQAMPMQMATQLSAASPRLSGGQGTSIGQNMLGSLAQGAAQGLPLLMGADLLKGSNGMIGGAVGGIGNLLSSLFGGGGGDMGMSDYFNWSPNLDFGFDWGTYQPSYDLDPWGGFDQSLNMDWGSSWDWGF